MKPTPTQYTEKWHIDPGTQLVLTRCAYAGDYAQASFSAQCTHRPENHVVVRLRPDWKEYPAWKNSKDVPWEWVTPEPAFCLAAGEQVYVMSEVKVIHEAPPNYGPEPWERYMSLVTRLKDGKSGWCQSWMLEVPLL
jgi:hypothetical protein